MAKQTPVETAAPTAPAERMPPRLGELVHVLVAPGLILRNSETGAHFAPDVAAPQIVTPTTLRRLADGDLVLA